MLHDFGIAGDDAAELLDGFANRFNIDIESFAVIDFREQFGDEGGLDERLAVPFVVAAIIGVLFEEGWGVPKAWAFAFGAVIMLIVVAAVFYCKRRWWHREEQEPITVADLINAANAGRWVSREEADRWIAP